jgi:hypothetical protein
MPPSEEIPARCPRPTRDRSTRNGPWEPCADWWPPAVPAKGMITETLFYVVILRPIYARKSSVIMLPACRDGGEPGNQPGWISANDNGPDGEDSQSLAA